MLKPHRLRGGVLRSIERNGGIGYALPVSRSPERLVEIMFFAVLIGLLPAWIAHRKGRSFLAWWVFGALLFIVALPCSLLVSKDQRMIEKRALADGSQKCLFCAEIIKKDAVVCRYCGRDIAQKNDVIMPDSQYKPVYRKDGA